MEAFGPFLEQLFHNTAEIILLLVMAIVTACLGKIKTWWQDRAAKRFEKGINRNVRTRELLAELRVLSNADRVCLYQFFNGEYYLAGGSLMKCSLTHFVTKLGIANPVPGPVIPTTQMVLSLKALQDKPTTIFLHDTMIDDNFTDSLFMNTGTEVVVAGMVKDSRKNSIGILCVAWNSGQKMISLETVERYSRLIGEALAKRD